MDSGPVGKTSHEAIVSREDLSRMKNERRRSSFSANNVMMDLGKNGAEPPTNLANKAHDILAVLQWDRLIR